MPDPAQLRGFPLRTLFDITKCYDNEHNYEIESDTDKNYAGRPTRKREQKTTSPRPITTNNNSLTNGLMSLNGSAINSSCRIASNISVEFGILVLHFTEKEPADAERPINGQHYKTNAALHPLASSEAPDNQRVTYSSQLIRSPR
ncbi:unnamed protein product [Heligmosomoides polygyrus]|uniref:Uncharacterized protein n=1 Tax=Heligmosomoides polygyrus TaxID=6339 RepID=A0A3P7UAB4_HELPZ|nr:unnamed protein product [Heligmosomoides polygyrus]